MDVRAYERDRKITNLNDLPHTADERIAALEKELAALRKENAELKAKLKEATEQPGPLEPDVV